MDALRLGLVLLLWDARISVFASEYILKETIYIK